MRDDVRSRILDAGLSLLSEGGLQALSMRAVARLAGVSHQAPYHYFPDRESILAEIVESGFSTLHRYEEEAIATSGGAIERMIEIGCAYVRFALDHPALFQLMFRKELVDLDNFEQAHATAMSTFELPQTVVAAAYGKKPEESTVEMLACWSLSHGLATLMLEGKMPEALGETREEQEATARAVLTHHAHRLAPAD